MINQEKDNNMDLFILVENGQPVNHPVMGTNLSMFFSDFDPENPPAPFEKFKRIPVPFFNQMQKHVGTTYEKIDGVWQDVHHIEPLTEEEKNLKISNFINLVPKQYEGWIVDEENLVWKAPLPYPNDGLNYYWDDDLENWIDECKDELVNIISVKNKDELPPNGPTDLKAIYILETPESTEPYVYKWKKNEWQMIPITMPEVKLRDQTIIAAKLNNQQVKVLGVLSTKDDLESNYDGEIADAFIIDDINKLFAWDGTNWVIAESDEPV